MEDWFIPLSDVVLIHSCIVFCSLCVWVWGCKIAHYTAGFGKGCFFGLGCFSLVVCVWGEGLCHTLFMDAMLECVSVSVGHVGGQFLCDI